ncbi:MAG: hypothetical protein HC849_14765 [Oscillatoriales cyanobacterium RU_3_3]|nr:hypothetical protein [Oscillatoriales cyanobacterium RU_3_3]
MLLCSIARKFDRLFQHGLHSQEAQITNAAILKNLFFNNPNSRRYASGATIDTRLNYGFSSI